MGFLLFNITLCDDLRDPHLSNSALEKRLSNLAAFILLNDKSCVCQLVSLFPIAPGRLNMKPPLAQVSNIILSVLFGS